jgi:integrase
MSRRRLTDKQVAALKPRAARYTMPDPELVGHYVRVMPSGAKSYVAVARTPLGKQVWTTIGPADHFKIDDARDKAREAIKRIKQGLPAIEAPPPAADSFAVVAANWQKRHVAAKGLRTAYNIERCLNKYVLPHWGTRPYADIRRKDVAALLDHIEDNHGARQADVCLTIIQSLANWYATRDDSYQSPVVRGMKRATNGARARILGDDELRLIWAAADRATSFGGLVQVALLTGQRLGKLLDMRWSDVSADGVWTVPVKDREKGTGGELVLPEMALEVLRRQPRIFGTAVVFAPARGSRLSPSQSKTNFDATLPPLPRWTIHDLRRTARSLMARAGVPSDHAERVLGHVIGGVEGIYDRHGYREEKRIALAKLATLIGAIVSGQTATVTPLRQPST